MQMNFYFQSFKHFQRAISYFQIFIELKFYSIRRNAYKVLIYE